MRKFAWFIFCIFIAVSCLNEPDCYQLNNDQIIVSFNVLGFSADRDTLLDVRVSGTDSIFYTNTIVTNALLLPLNPKAKEVTYIFRWKNGRTDTLVAYYSAKIQFVSDECAQRYVFTDLTAPTSTFDSVRLLNGTPTYTPSINLAVYRCANPVVSGIKFKTIRVGTTQVDSVLVVSNVTADFDGQVQQNGPSFYLPLNKQKGITTFKFSFPDGSLDSLSLSYTRLTTRSLINSCDSVTSFSQIRIAATSFDTTSTTFTNTARSDAVRRSTSAQDPAIINFEILL